MQYLGHKLIGFYISILFKTHTCCIFTQTVHWTKTKHLTLIYKWYLIEKTRHAIWLLCVWYHISENLAFCCNCGNDMLNLSPKLSDAYFEILFSYKKSFEILFYPLTISIKRWHSPGQGLEVLGGSFQKKQPMVAESFMQRRKKEALR